MILWLNPVVAGDGYIVIDNIEQLEVSANLRGCGNAIR